MSIEVANDDVVRHFLVRLKKVQVTEALDRHEANGTSHISLLVPGITPRQIALTRSWVEHLVLQTVKAMVDVADEPPPPPDADAAPAPETQP